MSIQIQCDKCQATYVVSDDKAGKTGKCRCGNEIAVPMPASASLPPLPPTPPQSILDELGPEGESPGQAGADSPFEEDVEGEAHIPGGMRCPKCQMISRPGAVCEWCSAALAPLPPPKPEPGPVGRPGARSDTVRPLGEVRIFGIIGDAFRLVFRYPGLCFGSVAIVTVVSWLVGAGIGVVMGGMAAGLRGAGPGGLLTAMAALVGIVAVIGLAIGPLSIGPMYVMRDLLARGKSDIGAVFRGYSSYFSIIGAGAIIVLIFMCVGFVVGLIQFLLMSAGVSSRLALQGGVVVFELWLAIGLVLTFPEIVDRKAGAIEALGTSWETTDGYRMSIFVLGLLAGVGAFILLFLTSMAGGVALGKQGSMAAVYIIQMPLMLVVSTVANAIQMVLYRDLRGLEG